MNQPYTGRFLSGKWDNDSCFWAPGKMDYSPQDKDFYALNP